MVPFSNTEWFFVGGIVFNLSLAFKLNVKCAIILNEKIAKLGIDLNQNKELQKYFTGILIILNYHPNQNEYNECSKLIGFDKLLATVINFPDERPLKPLN